MFWNNPVYPSRCALPLPAPTSLLRCSGSKCPLNTELSQRCPHGDREDPGRRYASQAVAPSMHFCSLSTNTHGQKARIQVSKFSRNNSGGQELQISQQLNLETDEPSFATHFQKPRILACDCQRLNHLPRATKRQRGNMGR